MDDAHIDNAHLIGAEATDRLRGLLRHFRRATLTAVATGSTPPLPTGEPGPHQAFGGTLWFFCDERSRNVGAMRSGAEATVLLQSDDADSYLRLRGIAEVVKDEAKMAEWFSPVLKRWFPKGLDDPFLALIRFEVLAGRPAAGAETGDSRPS